MPELVASQSDLLELSPKPVFKPIELGVLRLASHGYTVNQAARKLETSCGVVRIIRDVLVEKFAVPTMAAVVHQAFQQEVLLGESRPRPEISNLDNAELEMLQFFAQGLIEREIALEFGEDINQVLVRNRQLLKKLRASGRNHSMRRAHEFGIELEHG